MPDSNKCIKKKHMMPREPAISDHDYVDVPNMPSTFKDTVVEYIAGYVVKSTEKAIMCTECKLGPRTREERNLE